LAQFIDTSGGIRKLIGADKYYEDGNNEPTKKSKSKSGRSADDEALLESKHLELGVQHFATAKSILNLQSPKPISVNRLGYALALIRAKPNGTFDVLATVSEEAQIRKAIIASYKRDNTAAPTVLQLLIEVIASQSIPKSMERHRDTLQDSKKVTTAAGEVLAVKQYKRLLFRKKQGDIVLSENRAACSVVTVVKPKVSILASSKDVFLRVQDRRYLEQAIIQQQDLSIYTANDKDKVPVLRDTDVKASHRLVVENKLLKSHRAIYFYALDTVGAHSRAQADVNAEYAAAALWTASVDKLWIENLYVGFVGSWLNEYGEHITRPPHRTVRMELGRTQLVFKHYGERGNLTTASKIFDIAKIDNASKPFSPTFLTKDILPVLASLSAAEIVGSVKIAVNEDVLRLSYKTTLAAYTISVPTCTTNAKRNDVAFAAYGG
jgi:D-ribose pyranose/furanose isomerase RbsD